MALPHSCSCPSRPWCVPHGWAGTEDEEHNGICADHDHVAAPKAPLMDAEQRAAMEARHRPLGTLDPAVQRCSHDYPAPGFEDDLWPCDTERMRAALAAVEADRDRIKVEYDRLLVAERDAAAERDEARAALAATEALARRLAEALDDAVRDAHAYGPVRDHWGTPIGDGPIPFEDCADVTCAESRAALAAWRERHGEDGA